MLLLSSGQGEDAASVPAPPAATILQPEARLAAAWYRLLVLAARSRRPLAVSEAAMQGWRPGLRTERGSRSGGTPVARVPPAGCVKIRGSGDTTTHCTACQPLSPLC